MQSGGVNRLKRWASALCRLGVFGAMAVLILPKQLVTPPASGLDPSVYIALQLAVEKHLLFGKDFVLTYGPLAAYAVSRLPIGISKWGILAFDALFLANVFCLLVFVYRRVSRPFDLFLVFLTVLGTGHLYWTDFVVAIFLLLLFHLHCALEWKEPSRIFASLTLATLCSAAALYIKVNMGIVSVFLVLVHLAVAMASSRDRRLRLQYAAFTLAYLVFLPLTALLFRVQLWSYLRTSLDLIDAYNDAMYLPVVRTESLYAALATGAAFCAVSCFAFLRGKVTAGKALRYAYAGFALFLFFKQAFVRGDHLYTFSKFAPIAVGFLALFAEPGERRGLAQLYVLTVLLAFPFSVSAFQPERLRTAWSGFYTYLAEARKPWDTSVPPAPADVELPAHIRDRLGAQTVDVNPQETSYVYFNRLNYRGRPVSQSYICNTGYLDELNAQSYLSPAAPEFILFSIGTIDDRYPFFDETKTKLALLRRYEVVDRFKDQLLLRKLPKPLDLHERQAGVQSARLGQLIPLTKTAELQLMQANIQYSLLGKLVRFLFQPPKLRVVLQLEDGSEREFRAIKPLVNAGLLVNRYVEDIFDANLFVTYNGEANQAVKAIRFEGSRWGFGGSFDWQIKYLSIGPGAKSDSVVEFEPPKPALPLPAGGKDVNFAVDQLIDTRFSMHARGWAFLKGQDASGSVISVILRGKKTYSFHTSKRERPDVTAAFHVGNLDESGFSIALKKGDLEPGEYGLWLDVQHAGHEEIGFTNRIVNVSN